jgi:two-component system chemotaxis sensor kinase CheA
METLLDEMRDGRRQVAQETVNLLLQSVDCLRDMLIAVREGAGVERQRVLHLQHHYERLLSGAAEAASESGSPSPVVASAGLTAPPPGGWHILFRPQPHMLQSGNDPVRMFRELETLGALAVRADTSRLPAFADLDPEECYLGWELTLLDNVSLEQLHDVFAWVEGDCELYITPLQGAAAGGQRQGAGEVGSPDENPRHPCEDVDSDAGQASSDRRSLVADHRSGGERRSSVDRRTGASTAETTSIRVSIDKIDALVNMVGELVITQAMLTQLGEHFTMSRLDKLRDGLDQLERNTRELQESVMRIRMVPISFAFHRFPRLVHDLSQQLGKKVELKMSGEQTELDKTVMEKIGDPLVHLVRNALDHGIEPPALRQAAGKPETGLLHLHAYHQGGNILIEVSDDGAGLQREKLLRKACAQGLLGEDESLPDEKLYDVIFQPGFSTAEAVSDVSGRGVGMDVVRRNIKELGGQVDVRSQEGHGTTFTIRLPLTLAILDGQLVRVGQEIYIIPLVSIVESLQIESALLNTMAGQAELYKFRNDYLPIVRLHDLFHLAVDRTELAGALLVVVEAGGHRVGLVVDELLGQQQIVIKSLESNFKRVAGVSGATILGDGTVALILDIAGLIDVSQHS